jgi:hypothetical protein
MMPVRPMVMLDWGDRWFRAPEGPQIQVGGDPPKG